MTSVKRIWRESLGASMELFLIDYDEQMKKKQYVFRSLDSEVNKLVTPIRSLPESIFYNTKLREDIMESIDVLRQVTNSSGVEFYLVDSGTQEVFICPRTAYESFKIDMYKIGPDSILSAYVAGIKKPYLSEDVTKDKKFPMGISRRAFSAKCALALPVVTSKNDVLGVIELTKEGTSNFNVMDLEVGMNMCSWISSAVEQFYNKRNLQIENELYYYFIQLLERSICDDISFLTILPEILTLTSYTLCAETNNFYIYSLLTALEEYGDKVLMFSLGDGIKYNKKVELHVTLRTIANEIFAKSKILNLEKKDISTRYITAIYKPLDVKSILAVPITVSGSTRGVVELINKRDNPRFTNADILLLTNALAFVEFIVSRHVLKKQITYLHNFLAYRHDTLVHKMKNCNQELYQMNLSSDVYRTRGKHNDGADMVTLCLDIDSMFLEILKKWKKFDEKKRRSFLLMVLKATLISTLNNMRQIWCSVQFVATVLKTYANHFTESEKEVMMFSTLCYEVNMPAICPQDIELPSYVKPFPEPEDDTGGFVPCDSYYILKTIIVRSQLYKLNEVKLLMDQINVHMQMCHTLRTFDIKEKLLVLLVKRQLRLKNAKHRYLMRACIMVLSGQAIYLKPALFAINILLNAMVHARANELEWQAPDNDILSYMSSKEDVTKAVLVHLRVRVLPWVILLRCVLPRLKLFLKRCIETIDDWKKFETKNISKYWFPEKSTSHGTLSTLVAYIEGVQCRQTLPYSSNTSSHEVKRKQFNKNFDETTGEFNNDLKNNKANVKVVSKHVKTTKQWNKTSKRLSELRKLVEMKIENLESKKLKKAHSKRHIIKKVLAEKKKTCPIQAEPNEIENRVIIVSKKSKKEIFEKVMEALSRNPERVKANLKLLLEKRKKENFLKRKSVNI